MSTLWVSDLTCIWAWHVAEMGRSHRVYLEVFSRKVVGWKVSETMEFLIVNGAAKMARQLTTGVGLCGRRVVTYLHFLQ